MFWTAVVTVSSALQRVEEQIKEFSLMKLDVRYVTRAAQGESVTRWNDELRKRFADELTAMGVRMREEPASGATTVPPAWLKGSPMYAFKDVPIGRKFYYAGGMYDKTNDLSATNEYETSVAFPGDTLCVVMDSKKNFCELKLGARFLYSGRTYVKKTPLVDGHNCVCVESGLWDSVGPDTEVTPCE